MTPRDEHVVRAGDRLGIKDGDYKFGVGNLTAEVTLVIELAVLEAEPWWHVRALCRRAATDQGAERELYIRAKAVRQARIDAAP